MSDIQPVMIDPKNILGSRYQDILNSTWMPDERKLFYNLAELRVTNSWEPDNANY